MKIRQISKPKNILLICGLLITIISFFLPLSTSCDMAPGTEEAITTSHYGYNKVTYYIGLLFIAVIIAASNAGKGSLILSVGFTIIGGSIIMFFHWVGQAGLGSPCGNFPTQFQNLLYAGYLLIIFACHINIFQNRRNNKKSNVLDDF